MTDYKRKAHWTSAVAVLAAVVTSPLWLSAQHASALPPSPLVTANVSGTSYQAWVVQTGAASGNLSLVATGQNADVVFGCVSVDPNQTFVVGSNYLSYCASYSGGGVEVQSSGASVTQSIFPALPSGFPILSPPAPFTIAQVPTVANTKYDVVFEVGDRSVAQPLLADQFSVNVMAPDGSISSSPTTGSATELLPSDFSSSATAINSVVANSGSVNGTASVTSGKSLWGAFGLASACASISWSGPGNSSPPSAPAYFWSGTAAGAYHLNLAENDFPFCFGPHPVYALLADATP